MGRCEWAIGRSGGRRLVHQVHMTMWLLDSAYGHSDHSGHFYRANGGFNSDDGHFVVIPSRLSSSSAAQIVRPYRSIVLPGLLSQVRLADAVGQSIASLYLRHS